ncbi:hypothetical protein O998_00930 [Anaplasma phagocytophilum str. Norway variant1]|uniref:Histidine phosphotransferase ChpT C-terminal domain-containing protein n=1 Tax=Anaplasma phagocytophilum str. Norway variant1 TaxID=1392506 RepID=A0A7H9DXZ5_ANAPH|nr:histidine phosphotransferase family protein [Anaplasma phagocytophilum]QLL66458.1 hypothetical protein O998_00930 [Anaplasma phagocytophilum str. Norway variant1]
MTGELASMEAFAAKLLHDVAGSVGSVVSYIECFLDDPESDDIRVCLEEAAVEMISRFRLIRQAYSGSEDNSCFDTTREHIEKYLKKRGIPSFSLCIEGQFYDAKLVEQVNRLLVQAALFSAMAMVRGKGISVSISQTESMVAIRLVLDAEEISVHKDVESVLENANACALTTHNVQAYFMTLLCTEYGATLRYDPENALVEVVLAL